MPILLKRLISEDGGAHEVRGPRLCADRSGTETLNPQTLSDHLCSGQAACQLAHVSKYDSAADRTRTCKPVFPRPTVFQTAPPPVEGLRHISRQIRVCISADIDKRRERDSNPQHHVTETSTYSVPSLPHKCPRRDSNSQWILVRCGALARRIYQFCYRDIAI